MYVLYVPSSIFKILCAVARVRSAFLLRLAFFLRRIRISSRPASLCHRHRVVESVWNLPTASDTRCVTSSLCVPCHHYSTTSSHGYCDRVFVRDCQLCRDQPDEGKPVAIIIIIIIKVSSSPFIIIRRLSGRSRICIIGSPLLRANCRGQLLVKIPAPNAD